MNVFSVFEQKKMLYTNTAQFEIAIRIPLNACRQMMGQINLRLVLSFN